MHARIFSCAKMPEMSQRVRESPRIGLRGFWQNQFESLHIERHRIAASKCQQRKHPRRQNAGGVTNCNNRARFEPTLANGSTFRRQLAENDHQQGLTPAGLHPKWMIPSGSPQQGSPMRRVLMPAVLAQVILSHERLARAAGNRAGAIPVVHMGVLAVMCLGMNRRLQHRNSVASFFHFG